MNRFTGRTALVTGGARGIGRAVALRLAQEGANVAVSDISEEAASATAKEIWEETGAPAVGLSHDVRDEERTRAIPSLVAEGLGAPPDVVVCNAGIQRREDVLTLSRSGWQEMMDVHAMGSLFTMQAAARVMVPLGRGSIVLVSSAAVLQGSRSAAHYAAAKSAMLSLVKSFGATLAPDGIRVNAVAPGMVDTELLARSNNELAELEGVPVEEVIRKRVGQIPLRRMATPEDVAGAVAYLASDDAAYVTGECIYVTGGGLMF
ncbi:NAD(P)-dependent dehydrogenase (short-subunit alcohol dehydrogenase family) [Thermocatellispora tengchongensis]|uniref:NAD(P)-dependent dehydrogenase (Short-subunit alcohol dehydrogenase family) n=1 Tax=Thermocatellispora tengchongensis TaxID=1073253 RepID=A0A840PKZ3_9ACTN|nr:SDR family NAD(P)-dependent oxidoreductase [Thermocatellispora tengchongensis]MBB5138461.1 NAD(P)-dependent dehydrogenase (short-subunit alcohol dehydrogenase family) [Thermocatellispora tengchongensis]